VSACPEQAIFLRDGRSWMNRERCKGTGKCAEACPNEARNLMGTYMTAEEVFKDVAADTIFYERSGGGVTLSGGDSVSQPRFATTLLRMCKEAGLHTTLDTCGHARWETLRPMLEYVDLVLFDLKHMDPAEHQKLTGVSNEWILENAKRIHHEMRTPLLARVPIVPGYNDSMENIQATAKFITRELDRSIKVHLLPYHRLGETKYERLEKQGTTFSTEPPSEARLAELQQVFASFGLTTAIGG
jgi:pyruvate formate lyase activating enzyme